MNEISHLAKHSAICFPVTIVSSQHQWQQQQDVYSRVWNNYSILETINVIQNQDRWGYITLNSNDDSISDADNNDDDNHHNNMDT